MENLIGTYPIVIGGSTEGSLNVTQDRLYTVFDAACMDNGNIIRLSAYGYDWELYLGVMIPRGDKLYLKKRISRNNLGHIQSPIIFVGVSGQELRASQELEHALTSAQTEEVLAEPVETSVQADEVLAEPVETTVQADEVLAESVETSADSYETPVEQVETSADSYETEEVSTSETVEEFGSDEPDIEPDSSNEILWRRAPNGTLVAMHEGKRFMAIPSSVPGLPVNRAKDVRVIEDTEYLIFEIKK